MKDIETIKKEVAENLKRCGYNDEAIKKATDSIVKVVSPSRVLVKTDKCGLCEMYLN